MTQYVTYTDVSSHQGEINFAKMEDAGCKGTIIRKQIGYYTDKLFWQNFERAKKTSMLVGIYGVPFVGYDQLRQANKLMEGLSPGDIDLPPEADIERKHTFPLSKAISDMLAYMHTVKNWWGELTIYTAKFIWETMYSAVPGWIDDWVLHVANYTNNIRPWYIPRGWEERKNGENVAVEDSYGLWQWSADGNYMGSTYGASSPHIDLNKVHMWYHNKYANGVAVPPSYDVSITVPKDVDVINLNIIRA